MSLVTALPEILGNAVVIESRGDRQGRVDVEGYYTAVAPVEFEGERYTLRVQLRKNRRDEAPRLYEVTGFSLEGGSGVDRGPSTPSGQERGSRRALPPSGEVTLVQLINAIKEGEPRFAETATAGPGMTTDAVHQTIADMRLKWGKQAPRVVVVQSVAELPESIQEEAASGDGSPPSGVSHGSTVYMVTDGLRGPEHAQRILAHEAVGHYGLETMLGEEAFAYLLERIQVLKDAGEERITQVANEVRRRYGHLDQVTESAEILAEQGIRHPLLSRPSRPCAASCAAWA